MDRIRELEAEVARLKTRERDMMKAQEIRAASIRKLRAALERALPALRLFALPSIVEDAVAALNNTTEGRSWPEDDHGHGPPSNAESTVKP
jgi:hypothetical protein